MEIFTKITNNLKQTIVVKQLYGADYFIAGIKSNGNSFEFIKQLILLSVYIDDKKITIDKLNSMEISAVYELADIVATMTQNIKY